MANQNQVDLKFVVDSKQLTAANTKLDNMEDNLKDVQRASKTTANTFKGAGKNLGHTFQNAGYQVQDFIVQVQGGQGALRALSQQGSQLLAIFGPVGVFAGIGLSLSTSIIPALINATEEAKSFEDALKAAADASEKLKQDNLKLGLGGASGELIALYKEREKALENMRELEKKAAAAGGGHTGRNARKRAEKAREELEVLKKQITELDIQIAQNKVLNDLKGDQAQEADNLRQNEERARRAALEEEKVRLAYAKQMAALNKFKGEGETDYLKILNSSNTSLEIMKKLLGDSDGFAKALKDALKKAQDEASLLAKEAEKAAVALRGLETIGDGIARGISVARAELSALNNEANSGIATQIAGKRYDLKEGLTDAIAGGANRSEAIDEYISASQQLAEYERLLLDIERQRELQSQTTTGSVTSGTQAQIEKTLELSQSMQNQIAIFENMQDALGDGFLSMVDGTKSVEDSFREMARSVVSELYKVYVLQRMIGDLGQGTTAGTGLLGGIQSALGLPNIPAKASGGSIMAGQPYLVGEKGPELIVPRNRGHVMNADLTAGAMGGGDTINQTYHFQFAANGDDSVKRIIVQAMPSIVNASKQGVMDARRRGGAMKTAFG